MTPIATLQVVARRMPFLLLRMQLSLNYWVHLQGHEQDHPTQRVSKSCWEKETMKIKSFGWTATEKQKNLKSKKTKSESRSTHVNNSRQESKEATNYRNTYLLINVSKTELGVIVQQRIKERWQKYSGRNGGKKDGFTE